MESVRDLVALDTKSPKSAQVCFWKFPVFFYISGKSSKNLKNIWLHFTNSTVKTPKISLSPEMATQISGSDVFVYNIQQNSKQLHIKLALFQYPAAYKKTRALHFSTGRVPERRFGAGGLKRS